MTGERDGDEQNCSVKHETPIVGSPHVHSFDPVKVRDGGFGGIRVASDRTATPNFRGCRNVQNPTSRGERLSSELSSAILVSVLQKLQCSRSSR